MNSSFNYEIIAECRSTQSYCKNTNLKIFFNFYKNNIHGYASVAVCIISFIVNCLCFVVLTRKDMAAAPTNRLLKWLAVANLLKIVEYLPFSICKYLVVPEAIFSSFSGAMFLLLHQIFTQVVHAAAELITLSLAKWRFLAMRYSGRNNVLCSDGRCTWAIIVSFTLPLIISPSTYSIFTITGKNVTDVPGDRGVIEYVVDTDFKESTLFLVHFVFYAVLFKLLPCLLLTIATLWLIRVLCNYNKNQKNLRTNRGYPETDQMVKRQLKADKRTDRKIYILMASLMLFIFTELPQGILSLVSGLLGWCFYKQCFVLFSELMDLIALLNGTISFILYCSMSRQFRRTFCHLFLKQRLARRLPPAAHSNSEVQNMPMSSLPPRRSPTALRSSPYLVQEHCL